MVSVEIGGEVLHAHHWNSSTCDGHRHPAGCPEGGHANSNENPKAGDDNNPRGKLAALTKRPDPDYNLRSRVRYERRVFASPVRPAGPSTWWKWPGNCK